MHSSQTAGGKHETRRTTVVCPKQSFGFRVLYSRSTWRPRSSQTGQVSRCSQLCLNEVIKSAVEATPSGANAATCRNVFGESWIESAQSRCKHAAVCLGEEHGDAAAQAGQLVTAGMRNFGDKPFAFQTTKIVSRLSASVGGIQKTCHTFHEVTVGKSLDQIAETDQGGQYRHHSLFAEAKPCGIETIIGRRRSGHLAKGGHVGSGLRVCRFGVT